MKRLITGDKSFYKSLVFLAIPIALQNLITFAVGFADNVMIGALGDAAVSGVYVGGQIQAVLQMVIGGIEGAIMILGAQYRGRKDLESIRKVTAIGLRFAMIVGLIFTIVFSLFAEPVVHLFTSDPDAVREGTFYLRIVAFSYIFFSISEVMIASMRSVETAQIGMYISIIALVVNISLNWVFIFGHLGAPAMGCAGAAIATVISRIVEMTCSVLYVLLRDKKLNFRLSELKNRDKLLTRDFIRYGLPLMGGNIVWAINMLANTKILGLYNASVLTAASVAGTLNNMLYICMNGMSSAVGVITSKTVGAGLYEKEKEYAYTVQILFLGVGLLTGLVAHLVRDPFISLYGISSQAQTYSRQFINVLSITMIGSCYQAAALFGLVKSGGDISFVFKNDTIFVFLVVIPSAIIAYLLKAPAWVTFACLKCDQILKCFVAVVKINRFNWMKNLTRDKDGKENVAVAAAGETEEQSEG